MTTATVPLPVPTHAGTRLLGEVIAWACPGLSVAHAALVSALTDAGLEAGVARELAPRHAFSRACKRLSEQRIIRPVSEDTTHIRFQFTQESRSGDKFEYTLETMLTLDKQSGAVSCELSGLATLAQEELDRCIAVRTGSDVTRIVQRLFEKQADLFPIRPQGGTYFVPQKHASFVDQIQDFLNRVGGRLLRFPVSDQLDRLDGIIDTLAEGLNQAVADACREGARAAVREVLLELISNPNLMAAVRATASPAQVAQCEEPPSTPPASSFWGRAKATAKRAGQVVTGAAHTLVKSVAGAVKPAAEALRLSGATRTAVGVALGIGLTAVALGLLCPAWVGALLAATAGVIALMAAQVGATIDSILARFRTA